MGRAKRAIETLAELAPQTAIVRRDGKTEEVPVIKGQGSVNQSPITGESMPVDKRPVNDPEQAENNENNLSVEHRVFAGTINQSGAMEIQVTRLTTRRRWLTQPSGLPWALLVLMSLWKQPTLH